jgi:hypothetical protein
VLAAACFCGHLWVIGSSPDPLKDPFVLLVSLSVALNSVIVFALGLALLLVDVYPQRFSWLAQYKIQTDVNVPLPKDMLGMPPHLLLRSDCLFSLNTCCWFIDA